MGSYRLVWVPLDRGDMALGHRPGEKLRAQLEATGCTLVLNLLSASESRASVNDRRIRLPLAGAEPPSADRDAEVITCFEMVRDELARGGKVFIHCSAGLHRTGMVAHGYLRWRGIPSEEAVKRIRAMRPLTADELTPERLAWGNRFGPAAPTIEGRAGVPPSAHLELGDHEATASSVVVGVFGRTEQ